MARHAASGPCELECLRVPPPTLPMLSFAARLEAAVRDAGAPLCVGLDPDPERLPRPFAGRRGSAEAAREFCVAITESTREHAVAFKPNLAFFEALPGGWNALVAVCEAVRQSGRILVLDGKRGDIGNTGRRYAAALYDRLGGDAATVAPYMGGDSLAPFLEHAGRCAFVLVATSNPGAADLQALEVGGGPLYRRVARLAVEAGEGQPGEVGFVVGATRPALLADLRAEHPDVPLLVPGRRRPGRVGRERARRERRRAALGERQPVGPLRLRRGRLCRGRPRRRRARGGRAGAVGLTARAVVQASGSGWSGRTMADGRRTDTFTGHRPLRR